ncbi:MAG: hypothetical protein Devi2KO_39820 [Devosia indica]|uniref:Uncharacterized protein n=1 Tax=Devosia salina TaxID=2860336 RepID=A0ABX8WF97_9HYPH|nr:hypothetical protein [Devosia salina]QYO75651.1 hypothetical protein K1X15_13530 [Devosia salina]
MNEIETPEQRIERARKTLSGWGWMAVVSTRPDEVIRYLHLEVAVLGALALEDPRHAPDILALIAQFQALIDKIDSERDQPQSAEASSQRASTA